MDSALTTRLLDPQSMTEVLCLIEHKSQPGRGAVIQLLTAAVLSLHERWKQAGRPKSGNVDWPIPIMIIIYNGADDWDIEMWFQDLFANLPKELRRFVPQFQIMIINLKRFDYDNLPGKPETQAIAASMKSATDGTFVARLPSIFRLVAQSDLNESGRAGLGTSISAYGESATDVTEKQIMEAVNSSFTGQERTIMAETIKNSFVLEGIEIGEARAEAKGKPKWEAAGMVKMKINDILKLLQLRFGSLTDEIVNDVSGRTDLIALDSLFELAAQCKSLNEFKEFLK